MQALIFLLQNNRLVNRKACLLASVQKKVEENHLESGVDMDFSFSTNQCR